MVLNIYDKNIQELINNVFTLRVEQPDEVRKICKLLVNQGKVLNDSTLLPGSPTIILQKHILMTMNMISSINIWCEDWNINTRPRMPAY